MARPTCECPKCKKVKPMTRHHVFPVRHYGRKNNEYYFELCRGCHDLLEKTIPKEAVPKYLYPLFVLQFLEEPRMSELVCEKCGEAVEPEAAVVVYDLLGEYHYHYYCIGDKEAENDL